MNELKHRIQRMNSVVCVGLDPNLDKFPPELKDGSLSLDDQLFFFCSGIIEATKAYAACYKPQIAYFEQYGLAGIKAYIRILQVLREQGLYVISDIKRGDIGATANAYAKAFLSPGADFESDAVTINPYLGDDSNQEFYKLARENNKGTFVLVKTSNPSSTQLQNLIVDEQPVYEKVAAMIKDQADVAGAVVGATHPSELKRIRQILPNTVFLIPGYGAQGGKAEDLKDAFGKTKDLAVVNNSRGILYSFEKTGLPWKESAAKAAQEMRDALNEVRFAE